MAVNLGRDTSLTPDGGMRTGVLVSRARLVAEAIARRLTTRRGTLRGGKAEQNYGINLPDYVGQIDSALVHVALPGIVRAEVVKDERVRDDDSLRITVDRSLVGPGAAAYEVRVRARTGDGPFDLVLRVDEVTAEVLGITAGETS